MELSLMEKKMMEDKVSELLNEIGYRPDRDTYVDVVGFVRKHGFIVGNALLDDEEDGFLAIWQSAERNHKPGTAEYQKVIGVNVERELGWKRFIIAHEFAHSILHYQGGRIYLHREHTKGKNADENDADYFAAALLMPRDSFRRVYTELTQNGLHKKAICLQLAREYGVPLESVTRRIKEIKV